MGWVLSLILCSFSAGSSVHPEPQLGQGPCWGSGGWEDLAEAQGAARKAGRADVCPSKALMCVCGPGDGFSAFQPLEVAAS